MTILANVVSTSVPGQAVIDAGSKALACEPMRGRRRRVRECAGSTRRDHYEYVGRARILDLSSTLWRPRVGELVRIVPKHVCVAMCLQGCVHGETIETSWDVAARA